MFKNITAYRMNSFPFNKDTLNGKLETLQFNEVGSMQMTSVGFSPVVHDFVHQIKDDGFLIQFTIGKKILPAAVVKEFMKEKISSFIEQQGRKPKGFEKKEMKEAVLAYCMPKAFSVPKHTLAWFDIKNKLFIVNSCSKSVVGLLISALFKATGTDIELIPIQTKNSPVNVMTKWLINDDVPGIFTVDSDCLLKNVEKKSSLRFSQTPVQDESVLTHVNEGQLPNELGMTWNSRVSFTLSADMSIKKINLFDIVNESKDIPDDEIHSLEIDVLMEMHELTQIIHDLIDVMGGEMDIKV